MDDDGEWPFVVIGLTDGHNESFRFCHTGKDLFAYLDAPNSFAVMEAKTVKQSRRRRSWTRKSDGRAHCFDILLME